MTCIYLWSIPSHNLWLNKLRNLDLRKNWLNRARTEVKKLIRRMDKINQGCLFPAFSKINTGRHHTTPVSVRFKTNKRDYFFMLKANKVWKSQSQNRASARAAGGSKLELEKWKKNPSKIICLEGGCFWGSLWTSHGEGLKAYPESSAQEICLHFRVFPKYLPLSWSICQKRQSLGSDPAAIYLHL